MVMEKLDSYMNETRLLSYMIKKLTQWREDLNIKPETIKLLEGNRYLAP